VAVKTVAAPDDTAAMIAVSFLIFMLRVRVSGASKE
jgi:hypothetical protein